MHFFLVSRFPQSWDEHRTLITWWSALGSYTHHVAHNGTDLVLYHTHIPRLPASVLHRSCTLQAEPSCVQNLKPSNGLYRWVLARIQASENLSHITSKASHAVSLSQTPPPPHTHSRVCLSPLQLPGSHWFRMLLERIPITWPFTLMQSGYNTGSEIFRTTISEDCSSEIV